MNWGSVADQGKLLLIFIDKGLKINLEYYLNNVLIYHLIPFAKPIVFSTRFSFLSEGENHPKLVPRLFAINICNSYIIGQFREKLKNHETNGHPIFIK